MGVVILVLLVLFVRVNEAQLSFGYYETSCPNLETIVKSTILPILLKDLTAPAAFLRLMFHDCQVQGCDASILLDSDNQNINSEMVSSKNFMIRNRESIGHIKSVLEFVCPGQVSCADIIALAAKEAVSFSGGPKIQVPLGRKDSTSSSYKQADMSLPSSQSTVDGMLQIFKSKGMNLEESVAIMGSHTLGAGHCLNIVDRLYNPKHDAASTNVMDKGYEILLRITCPTKVPLTNLTFVTNDITPLKFDNQYYQDIINGRGLFGIDSSIARDPRTVPIVKKFADDQSYFFQVFASAFVKLSWTNVLTGETGQIRRDCSRLN
ncbi:Plant peroxidase [Macleaya cordata]|uniref:Peroxidase n=1 Tax=Macleaya cordata TaxID=56857 RepID=A0A200PZ02_MACCD|nr:Plant peroxidase [Macleaya cordata]